jgi:S-DNA-T family DNA segregation ATPase FtsK/SpoIIIE
MLVMFKDRPVKSRIICTLLLTIVVGALIHLFTCSTVFEWSWRLPGELYRTGITAGKAEAAASSAAACSRFKSLFNMIGATIVLGLSFIFLLLAAFDITFVTVAEW